MGSSGSGGANLGGKSGRFPEGHGGCHQSRTCGSYTAGILNERRNVLKTLELFSMVDISMIVYLLFMQTLKMKLLILLTNYKSDHVS